MNYFFKIKSKIINKMELEIDINKDEICRACLDRNKKDELKSIFSTDIVNGDIVLFSDIFEAATNSKVQLI